MTVAYEPTDYIDRDSLVVGGLYRLKARNLYCGVWNGIQFIGIREKFDRLMLDSAEVPYVTAFPIEKLAQVPDDIELATNSPATHRFNELLWDWLFPYDEAERER
jgi:hypothetical protein